jgi:hypothetical protein
MNLLQRLFGKKEKKYVFKEDPLVIPYLDSLDKHELAMLYCDLNRWKWTPELGLEEAPFINGEPGPMHRRRAIMNMIEARVGEKYISYVWNCEIRVAQGDGVTSEEFEHWWRFERFN